MYLLTCMKERCNVAQCTDAGANRYVCRLCGNGHGGLMCFEAVKAQGLNAASHDTWVWHKQPYEAES